MVRAIALSFLQDYLDREQYEQLCHEYKNFEDAQDVVWPFGKYAGEMLSDMFNTKPWYFDFIMKQAWFLEDHEALARKVQFRLDHKE